MIDRHAKAGSDIITFDPRPLSTYIPTSSAVTAMLYRIKSHGILSGLVLNHVTSVSSIAHLLAHEELEMVVIKVEVGGSSYVDEALFKAKEIKRLCHKHKVQEPYISVDGGVDEDNVPKFLAEGV